MVVKHNVAAMNANRMLGLTQASLSKSTEKLSSGYKVNRAADDAAGLSISEKMRKQIRGLTQASANAEDGISSVQTAEGALTEVHDMLQRMNELAVKAANGTNSESDRQSIQDEIKQLTTEIDRVAETTKFNETYLLKGDKNNTQKNYLVGHDAGMDGVFTDGNTTATLKVDLSVGKSLSIAGQSFNIVSDSVGNAATAKDSLSKIQGDIAKIGKTDAKVTINGTEYESRTNDAGDLIFDAGTGVTYTALELSGMVSDGTKVSITGAKDSNGDAIEDTANKIARDYSSSSNITASDAAKKIQHALEQANRVGDTDNGMSVTNAKSVTVGAVTLDDAGSAKADVALIAYNATDGTMKEIAANDDITEYLQTGSQYTLYKQVAAAGGTFNTVAASANALNDTLLVHNDGAVKGARAVAAGSALTGDGIQGTPNGTATVATNYTAYEAVSNPLEVATITGASHEAYAKLTDANISLDFEDVSSQDIADGQNKFLAEIGNINVTYTDTNGTGVFSHSFTDKNLDIDESGVVSYKGEKVATLTLGTGTTVAGTAALALNGAKKDAEFISKVDNDEYTFTINKGSTTVAKDLNFNIHVGADADMTNKIGLTISAMTSESLGIADLNVADGSGVAATYAVDAISDAIAKVSAQRSALGAIQNRLEHTVNNLDNVIENTTASESQIRDTDIATEMVSYSNNNILVQAGQSMLAQANQSNQGALSLLG